MNSYEIRGRIEDAKGRLRTLEEFQNSDLRDFRVRERWIAQCRAIIDALAGVPDSKTTKDLK